MAMNVTFEWIAIDKVSEESGNVLFCLPWDDWDQPIPRVGDSIAPPSHRGGRDGTQWVVTYVTWEFALEDYDDSDSSVSFDGVFVTIHEIDEDS